MLFTLFMPPYQFKRKSKARYIGKKATFECISCAKNDVKTYHTMSNCPSCHWYCIKVQKILTIGFSYTSIGQTYFHKTEIFWWVLLEIAASMHSPFCQIWRSFLPVYHQPSKRTGQNISILWKYFSPMLQ